MQSESITKVLWREAKAGDPAAFDRLFALHRDRLLVYVRTRLGSALREKIDPEDLLQEGYLAAVKCFSDFDYTDEGAFFRWMCRIIGNRLRDAHDYFHAKKRQANPLGRSDPTGPVTALVRKENRHRVEAALSQLKDDHREVLLLRYFEGLSADEAAQRMQRTAGAIRNLSTRALIELSKQLGTLSGPET